MKNIIFLNIKRDGEENLKIYHTRRSTDQNIFGHSDEAEDWTGWIVSNNSISMKYQSAQN